MPAADENQSDWYVMRGRVRGGPYPYAFVSEGAKGGLISRYDLVWRPGWIDWHDAGGMDGLVFATESDGDARTLKGRNGSSPPPAAVNAALPIAPRFSFETSPDEDADRASYNYITGHWRGEFSLPAALWGNGLVVGLILVIAASAVYTILEQTKVGIIQFAMIAIVLLLICLASVVWLLVGVLRSALRHRSGCGVRWRAWLIQVLSRGGASGAKPT
jgi:hypothetical protein